MPRKYIKKNVKKKYSDNDFKLAIETVTNGSSIREASDTFHVLYTTLNSYVNNEVLYDQVGRPTEFSKEEEVCLEQSALALQSWGMPLSIDEFLKLSKEYALSLNKSHLFPSGTPTYDWLRCFLKRHKNLVLKNSSPIEKKRAAVTSQQIESWFELLSKIIQENGLANHPAQLFNCDETGLSDCISYSKVLVHRRTANAYRIQGGSGKAYTSVMFCASATGFLLPPYVVYKSKRLFQEWCSGGPPDTGFNNSENGWMEQTLFYKWFEQIFLQHTKNLPRPIVLIVDGHGSHFKVETLKLAVENSVIILCLPSHSSHILQPLDVVFFNPLKIEWKKILKMEYNRTHNKVIGKPRFPSLLKQLWETEAVAAKTNIVKSFMKAGVFPLNPKSIDGSRVLQNNASSGTSSSTVDINNNLTNDSSSPISLEALNDHNHLNNNHRLMNDTISSAQSAFSSFTSSQDAISALDRVLGETMLNESTSDNDDEDEDYVPNQSISASSKTVSSMKKRKSLEETPITITDNPSISSQQKTKRTKTPLETINIDISDDDDNTNINISPEKSQQPTKLKRKSRAKKSSRINHLQSDLLRKGNKRKQVASKIIGFDTSDEDDIPPKESEESLKAITNTLQVIFGASSQQPPIKPSQRTMLKRSSGQIMTEKDVIEQIEEQKKKKNSKRSRPTNQTFNNTKRSKTAANDPPVTSTTSSSITIRSSNVPEIPTQSSITINTSSVPRI